MYFFRLQKFNESACVFIRACTQRNQRTAAFIYPRNLSNSTTFLLTTHPFTHIFTTFTRPSKNPSLVFSMGPTYNCPSTTSGSSTTLQSNCPYLLPKSTKTISPTSTSSPVLALNSAISCAISSLDGSLWRWVSVAAQRQL